MRSSSPVAFLVTRSTGCWRRCCSPTWWAGLHTGETGLHGDDIGGQNAEGGVALEHGLVGRWYQLHLEVVVHDTERIGADLLGCGRRARQCRCDRGRTAGYVEANYVDAQLHRVTGVAERQANRARTLPLDAGLPRVLDKLGLQSLRNVGEEAVQRLLGDTPPAYGVPNRAHRAER